MRLPMAIGVDPENTGIPIMGITTIWASSHGATPYSAPRSQPGPGSAGAMIAYPMASTMPIIRWPIQPSNMLPPMAPASNCAGFMAGIPISGATQSPTAVMTSVATSPAMMAFPQFRCMMNLPEGRVRSCATEPGMRQCLVATARSPRQSPAQC